MVLPCILVLVDGSFFINIEDPDFKSSYDFTDGKSLMQEISGKQREAMVIITSPSCPGVPNFIPKIQAQQPVLGSKDLDVYYVIDMLNKESDDLLLGEVMQQYNIQYIPLIIHPIKHSSVNLFNTKSKYDTFLTELCDTCNDCSLGYALCIYFRNGIYTTHSYSLDDQSFASLE